MSQLNKPHCHSRFLQKEEAQRALELLGFLVTKQDEGHIMRCVTVCNGRLNCRAFQQLVADWHGVTRDFYTQLKTAFSIIDQDKDGHITISDLQEVSRLVGIHFSHRELTEMIQEADQDGDRAVDMNEFIKTMLKTNLF
ncbi:uncharacterized protein LOC128640024 [Bombina bombina]|uniref:uncharacterized protein LOC128640024 n=1 Tax=Bombina bombina TaxID=8345 RepID=UPI00235A7F10|nr:uncharacterized protein LOC128640024 [Bombina bombina]